jgi:hypothetical protein
LRADREFLINNFSDNDANGMGTGWPRLPPALDHRDGTGLGAYYKAADIRPVGPGG